MTITFKQHIGATDALRTGAYSKTLTFTLGHHHAVTGSGAGSRIPPRFHRAAGTAWSVVNVSSFHFSSLAIFASSAARATAKASLPSSSRSGGSGISAIVRIACAALIGSPGGGRAACGTR